MRLVAYVALPSHWHLVVWPSRDGALSPWAQWLTVTHVRRWHSHRHTERLRSNTPNRTRDQ